MDSYFLMDSGPDSASSFRMFKFRAALSDGLTTLFPLRDILSGELGFEFVGGELKGTNLIPVVVFGV